MHIVLSNKNFLIHMAISAHLSSDLIEFSILIQLWLDSFDHSTLVHDAIELAEKSGFVYGVKLYPAGATTNSQDGVTDLFGKCLPVLEEMVEQDLPLLVLFFFFLF